LAKTIYHSLTLRSGLRITLIAPNGELERAFLREFGRLKNQKDPVSAEQISVARSVNRLAERPAFVFQDRPIPQGETAFFDLAEFADGSLIPYEEDAASRTYLAGLAALLSWDTVRGLMTQQDGVFKLSNREALSRLNVLLQMADREGRRKLQVSRAA
jgi:hypothetical protein